MPTPSQIWSDVFYQMMMVFYKNYAVYFREKI
jgi:hypothetical protein